MPKGQGEVKAQASGNLSRLSIRGYHHAGLFEVQIGDGTGQESATGCPGGEVAAASRLTVTLPRKTPLCGIYISTLSSSFLQLSVI